MLSPYQQPSAILRSVFPHLSKATNKKTLQKFRAKIWCSNLNFISFEHNIQHQQAKVQYRMLVNLFLELDFLTLINPFLVSIFQSVHPNY